MGPIEEDMKEQELSPKKAVNLFKSYDENITPRGDSPFRPFKIQPFNNDSKTS